MSVLFQRYSKILQKYREPPVNDVEAAIVDPPEPPPQPVEKSSFPPAIENRDDVPDTIQRYPLLRDVDVKTLTHCDICKFEFTFFSDYLYHFNISNKCAAETNAKRGWNHEEPKTVFLMQVCNSLNSTISQVAFTQNYKCCNGTKIGNATEYALHRDYHESSLKFYMCQTCTRIFKSSMKFYMHECLVSLDVPPSKNLAPGISPVKIKSNYPNLEETEISAFLKCSQCQNQFDHATEFLNHLSNPTTNCFQETLDDVGNNDAAPKRSVNCHICEFKAESQWSYMIHTDHHKRPNIVDYGCRVCKRSYDTICAFFNHSCLDESSLHWCIYCAYYQNITESSNPPPSSSSSSEPMESTTESRIMSEITLEHFDGGLSSESDSDSDNDQPTTTKVQPNSQEIYHFTVEY